MTKVFVSRLLAPLAAVLLVVGVAAPTQAATKRAASHVSLITTQTVKIGSVAIVTGTVSPAAPGTPVTLQRLVGKKWTKLATAKVASHGIFAFKLRASKKSSAWNVRIVRKATTKVAGVISKTQLLHIVKTAYTIYASYVSPGVGLPIVVTGSVSPHATGSVSLQLLTGKLWRTVHTVKLSKASTFSVSLTEPLGSYALRVIKAFSTSVAAGTGTTLKIAVLPVPASPVVSSNTLANAVLGRAYTSTLVAAAGVPPYTWSLDASTLPAGLSLSTAGVISGSPTAPGTTALTVVVTDVHGHTGSAHLSLDVQAPSLVAWGDGESGQLGAGYYSETATPTQVTGLTSVTGTASGTDFTLAVKSDGTVWAWGANEAGQLGIGTLIPSSVPVQVHGLTGITAVSAGSGDGPARAYARKSDGTVWAWGDGFDGLLGNGSTVSSSIPVQVSGLTNVTAIAAGGLEVYALKSNETVWAWGSNFSGGLGNGNGGSGSTNQASDVPVQVTGITTAISIAAGDESGYALLAGGAISAWGDNADGELGNGTTNQANTPVAVTMPSGLSGVTAIAAGDQTAYALGAGDVWFMGRSLGLTNNSTEDTPVKLSGISLANSIGAGDDAGYAIGSGGQVLSWGLNYDDDLGNSQSIGYSYQATPVPGVMGLAGSSGVTGYIDGGNDSVSVVGSDHKVYTWGNNSDGQLGNGVTSYAPSPIAIPNEPVGTTSTAISVYAGYAVTADGSVWAWGSNAIDNLGQPATTFGSATFLQVPGISSVTSVAAGDSTVYALKSDGTVWSWGSNTYGALGTGSSAIVSSVPAQLPGLSHVVQVTAGFLDGYALEADGSVWSWGFSQNGSLGTGSTSNSPVPVQISGLSSIKAIADEDDTGYAVRSDGTLWAWGDNSDAQVGDGTSINRPTPVQDVSVSGAAAVGAGEGFAVVLKSDGTLASWGDNSNGELGLGFTGIHQATAVPIPGVTGVTSISVGLNDSFAVRSDGTVWAWGNGYLGALGTGGLTDMLSPTVIPGLTGVVAVTSGYLTTYALKTS